MTTDRELLGRYVHESSEEAFAEIVRRHVDLVYGTALRALAGNVTQAHDVTQAVFTALAANAAVFSRRRQLSARLYTTTRFTVLRTVRTKRRRAEREQKAPFLHIGSANPGPHEAPELPPELLDEVLEGLDDRDREAILLRFMAGQSFTAIGSAMEASEEAARAQATRALEKVTADFARKGIPSSAVAIGAALAGHAVAAPVNLAASVTAATLAGVAAIAQTAGARPWLAALVTAAKVTAWLAGAAAIGVLGYSRHHYRRAALRGEAEASRLGREKVRLEEELQQNGQRSVQVYQQAAQAEYRARELQRKLDGYRVEPDVRSAKSTLVLDGKARQLSAEKMARMKPLLEKGMPIKGAVVVLVDGRPAQRPVEFVMGKETRIEAVDDGTYIVRPTLNEDGMVKYALSLLTKDLAAGRGRVEMTFPAVVQFPWVGFSMAAGGKVLAFDPDKTEF